MAVVITTKGKDLLAARLIGATPTQTEPKFVGWGTQNGLALTAAATDVAPFAESAEARTTGTATQVTTTTTNDTYQLVGTITATGTRAINEVFIADSATKPAAAAVAAGGVVGSAVSTTLNTAATFTPGNNYIQIRTEVMLVTAGSGTTALTVTRAQNGTSAISTIAVADVVQPGNPPGNSAVAGGSLLLHADHGVNNLSNGDSLQYTLKIQNT